MKMMQSDWVALFHVCIDLSTWCSGEASRATRGWMTAILDMVWKEDWPCTIRRRTKIQGEGMDGQICGGKQDHSKGGGAISDRSDRLSLGQE